MLVRKARVRFLLHKTFQQWALFLTSRMIMYVYDVEALEMRRRIASQENMHRILSHHNWVEA
jgi:hypothetical protein